ncbi:MAG: TAXI family TRAP transporter solute-binding subunit [Desulfarculus sp.]|jgi:TRAP transporter TAXI family solute receptor|nr:MAG: TAXI family TRAP transporter solute-binding subunit [Desulfarculus sp.]
MKRRIGLIGSCLVLGLAGLLVLIGAPAQAKNVPIPKMMTWTAYDVGSSGYMLVGHVGATLFDKYKIKVRLIPAGTDIPRVYPVRLKDAEVAFHGLGSYFMQEGEWDYSTPEWGPQAVRALYFAQHPGLCLGVRGDSPIKTYKDLKGKKIAKFPTHVLTLISEVHLVYAGLTWNDVQGVMTPGYAAAIKMVMDKKIDATHINPTASLAYEMQSMPYGVRYVELPFDNKEAWARVKKFAPPYDKFKATIGAGLSNDKPLYTVSYSYPIALAYDFLSDDKAYAITKLLVEAYPDYAKRDKALNAFWSPKGSMELFEKTPLPMHQGSIKYLKEAGYWKAAHDKMQAERLERQAKLKALWTKSMDEALAKKMKMKDFPKYWLQKKKEAGL